VGKAGLTFHQKMSNSAFETIRDIGSSVVGATIETFKLPVLERQEAASGQQG
jgi:hypothetical protein